MNEDKRPIETFIVRAIVALGPLFMVALYANVLRDGSNGILHLCFGVALLNIYSSCVFDLVGRSDSQAEHFLLVGISLAIPVLICLSGYDLSQINTVIDNFLGVN